MQHVTGGRAVKHSSVQQESVPAHVHASKSRDLSPPTSRWDEPSAIARMLGTR